MSAGNHRQIQTAYDQAHVDARDCTGIDSAVYSAMFHYLTRDLGLPRDFASERSRLETERGIPRQHLETLRRAGIDIAGRRVLELGCGLGGFAVEAALAGAKIVCIEPGRAWRRLAAARLRAAGARDAVLGAEGERLPVASNTVDVVVSLQVLEHVWNPEAVIAEVFRVLKPGGVFYFSCENYLAFREMHYKVPWLPLLPKPVGALYLRALGRSPDFLLESVTYVTRPGIIRALRRSGFLLSSEQAIKERVQRPQSARSPWIRLLASLLSVLPRPLQTQLIRMAVTLRGLFAVGIQEICYRP